MCVCFRSTQLPARLSAHTARPFGGHRSHAHTHAASGDHDATTDHVPPPATDRFSVEFQRNHIPTTPFQRFVLSAGSSVAALVNPHRHDMIACLGETTGLPALQAQLAVMGASNEGARVLASKPRINSTAIDLAGLAALPDSTFGYQYSKFLRDNASRLLFAMVS